MSYAGLANHLLETITTTTRSATHTLSHSAQNITSAINHNLSAHPVIAAVPTEIRVGSIVVVVKERIAEGGFGFVELVQEIHSKRDYVLKRCNIDREESYLIVKKEINMLQRFSGPYVVQLIDSDTMTVNKSSTEALLLLDYCPGGHLLDRLKKRNGKHLPTAVIYRIFGQILLSLKPMHGSNPPVIHRDLKLENILFASDGIVRLCDFGSCVEGFIHIRNPQERSVAEEIINKQTTQMYRAPEMIDLYMRDILTEKTDIWALGCIFFAICYLIHPFQDAGSLGILNSKYTIPQIEQIPAECVTMLQRMLDIDPEARPSVNQLIEAFDALTKGEPLPVYELSAEAIQKREERIAANKIRAKKNQKKNSNAATPPVRVIPPVHSNSVAARRLAAKRGGNKGSTETHDDLLDNFEDHGHSVEQHGIDRNNEGRDSITIPTQFPVEFLSSPVAPSNVDVLFSDDDPMSSDIKLPATSERPRAPSFDGPSDAVGHEIVSKPVLEFDFAPTFPDNEAVNKPAPASLFVAEFDHSWASTAPKNDVSHHKSSVNTTTAHTEPIAAFDAKSFNNGNSFAAFDQNALESNSFGDFNKKNQPIRGDDNQFDMFHDDVKVSDPFKGPPTKPAKPVKPPKPGKSTHVEKEEAFKQSVAPPPAMAQFDLFEDVTPLPIQPFTPSKQNKSKEQSTFLPPPTYASAVKVNRPLSTRSFVATPSRHDETMPKPSQIVNLLDDDDGVVPTAFQSKPHSTPPFQLSRSNTTGSIGKKLFPDTNEPQHSASSLNIFEEDERNQHVFVAPDHPNVSQINLLDTNEEPVVVQRGNYSFDHDLLHIQPASSAEIKKPSTSLDVLSLFNKPATTPSAHDFGQKTAMLSNNNHMAIPDFMDTMPSQPSMLLPTRSYSNSAISQTPPKMGMHDFSTSPMNQMGGRPAGFPLMSSSAKQPQTSYSMESSSFVPSTPYNNNPNYSSTSTSSLNSMGGGGGHGYVPDTTSAPIGGGGFVRGVVHNPPKSKVDKKSDPFASLNLFEKNK